MIPKIKGFIKFYLTPIILFVFGIFYSINYLSSNDISLLSLNVLGNKEQIIATRSGELWRGDVVRGNFYSVYGNLGSVSVRFYNQNRDSADTVIFRIKESSQEHWYYSAKYKTDQFQPHRLFPFGFPMIKDSANKSYVFEIESLEGDKFNSIFIDFDKPVFVSKSTFSRRDFLENKSNIFSFTFSKIINLFENREIRSNIFLFYIPFIFYSLFLLFSRYDYQFLSLFIYVMCFYDIFFYNNMKIIFIFSVLILWIMTSLKYKFESKISAVFSLIFLSMVPISVMVGNNLIAEKASIWVYLFLAATVLLRFAEMKNIQKNRISINMFAIKPFRFTLVSKFKK